MNENYISSIELSEDFNSDSFFAELSFIDMLKNGGIPIDRVTFFVGENGTGKSTLLEAAACAFGFNPEGGTLNFNFSTFDSHSDLYSYIKLVRSWKRPDDGFFFRAESYYNVASYIESIDNDGIVPLTQSYGGKSLHEQSHGESFFASMMYRFGGKGLYILDEPEAALSPQRQMSLLVRINELLKDDSQFIIATHSPILIAYPGALIYELSADGMTRKSYEQTDIYCVTKRFINDPGSMIERLFKE